MKLNKKNLPITLSISAAVIVAGCMNQIESVAKNADASDITNKILISTDPDCGAHVGDYSSSIADVSRNKDFDGMVTITASETNCTISANQIPNHNAGEGSNFAANIEENDVSLDIPRSPKLSSKKTGLGMGASAILLNGVKWEAYPAACFGVGNEPAGNEKIGYMHDQLENPWRYNIGSVELNNFGFDIHRAHVQPTGLYHYHSTPTALYEADCEGMTESPVVGYAADGFPIFGSCFKDASGTIRKASSSYQIKTGTRQDIDGYTTPYKVGNVKSDEYDGQFIGDHEFITGSGDLDECNGMTVNGQYGYYITEAYPYVLAYYSGTPERGFR